MTPSLGKRSSVFVSRPTWPIRDGGPWAPARPSRPSLGAWAGVVPRAQARPLSGGVPLTLDEFEVDVAGDEAGTSFTPAIDRWGPSGMERQTDAEGVPWATGNPAVFSYDKLVAGELRYRYGELRWARARRCKQPSSSGCLQQGLSSPPQTVSWRVCG